MPDRRQDFSGEQVLREVFLLMSRPSLKDSQERDLHRIGEQGQSLWDGQAPFVLST
jgi:hypothetical protein